MMATGVPRAAPNAIRAAPVLNGRRLGSLWLVPSGEMAMVPRTDFSRSVMGARGLTAEQVRFWDGVFQRLVKTDAWRQAIEKNQWEDGYMNSAEFGKDLKAQHEILKDALTELGMVKQ